MRKGMYSRAFRLLLVFCLVVAQTCACAQATTTTSTTTKNGSEETTLKSNDQPDDPFYIEGAEGKTFTYWGTMYNYQSQYYTTMAEHPYYKWREEKTGIKIEFIHPTWEQAEQQLTLMISSRNFYDFMENAYYPGGSQAAINEGCYIDLKPYLDKYMPNYKLALYDEGNETNSWEWSESEKEIFQFKPQLPAFAEKMHTFDGQLWGMSDVWRDEIPSDCGPIIRKDWLDEAGLEMPKTLDELEVVLSAFKDRGAVPMSLPAEGYVPFWEGSILISAFGTGGYFDLAEDGKTIEDHSYIKDEFKEYLTRLNKWYKAGYIDHDFMNSNWDSNWSKMVGDNLGIWLNYSGNPENIKSAYNGSQDFNIEPMPLPRMTTDQILRAKKVYLTEPTSWLAVTTSCKYPEIAAQWMDKHYTKEAILRQSYGIEGETYKMVDGVPVYLESFFTDENEPVEVKEQILLHIWGAHFWDGRASLLRLQRGDNTKLGTAMKAFKIWGDNAVAGYRIPYTVFEGDNWGIQENLVTEVRTYADPMILRFITGQESIEEKWDEFVQTCISLGIRDARDIWQKSYNKMLEIKNNAG